jgi:transcriptional regulator with XRE-family HTH domain
MTGEQLKHEIKRRGYTLRSVAAVLGIAEQNLGRKLKGASVSTEVIEAAAQVMGVTVGELYNPSAAGDNIQADHNSTAFKGTYSCDTRLLGIIETRDRQLDKSQQQIDRLLAIIEERLPKQS